MNMEEIKDGYFNYIVNEILEAIMNADEYTCKDFLTLKMEMLVNIHRMLQSREQYEHIIEVLNEDEKKRLK
jgi:hypothetical protein